MDRILECASARMPRAVSGARCETVESSHSLPRCGGRAREGTPSAGKYVGYGCSNAAGGARDDHRAGYEAVVLHDAAVFLSWSTAVRLLWFRKSSTTPANSSACSICGM